MGGAEVDTSEQLAHYILSHMPPQQGKNKNKPKLFYLTGDKNRDTLPNILHDGGVALEPLQVYETRGSSTFAAALRSVVVDNRKGTLLIELNSRRR